MFGPGYRANATIGRALRLVMINLGGTRAGRDLDVHDGPSRPLHVLHRRVRGGRRPWEPLHVEHGFAPTDSTVTLFSGEGPFTINDHLSRSASQLAASLRLVGRRRSWNHKSFPLYGHTLFVIGPEHAKTLGRRAGRKRDVRRGFFETIRRPARDLRARAGRCRRPVALKDLLDGRTGDERIPKFPSLEEIIIVVAGGTAGPVLGGGAGLDGRRAELRPVTRAIRGRG